ncbi:MAG: hypothetical protein AAF732_10360 [Pseudomonadota bacterium]
MHRPVRVNRVRSLRVTANDEDWLFARDNADKIAAHWQTRVAQNPAFFNGKILMLRDWRVIEDAFTATAVSVDFAAFLYWREQAPDDRSVTHVFGTAAIVLADGGVVTAHAGPGTINDGQLHLPGGFIDPQDIQVIGSEAVVDLDLHAKRELSEELGLRADELGRRTETHACWTGREIGLIGVYHSVLKASDLEVRLAQHTIESGQSEVTAVHVVRNVDAPMPGILMPYARAVVDVLLKT